jgi:hypothetical protein
MSYLSGAFLKRKARVAQPKPMNHGAFAFVSGRRSTRKVPPLCVSCVCVCVFVCVCMTVVVVAAAEVCVCARAHARVCWGVC